MKKLLTTVGILTLMNLMVLPVLAQQYQGYGMGPGMMGQGYNSAQRSSVDEETQKAYDGEMEKHYKATADQRQEIVVKQHEIATLLVNSKTTKDELINKQKEMQELMNVMQRDELSFRWDLHQKYPEMAPDLYRGCLAPAAGYGGPGMKGYGPYGRSMMDSDDYEGWGHDGMMGSGWGNRRNREHLRDKSK